MTTEPSTEELRLWCCEEEAKSARLGPTEYSLKMGALAQQFASLSRQVEALRKALERADRIIGWATKAIGHMTPPDDGIAALNEHWLYMQKHAALSSTKPETEKQ